MSNLAHRFQLVPAFLLTGAGIMAFLTLGLPETTMFQPVSAKVWPFILSGAMAVCAAVIFFENTREENILDDTLAEEDEANGPQGFIFLGAMLLAVPGLIYLGFLITCILVLGICGLLVEGLARPLRLGLTAICLPLGIYLLLTRLVGQYLPPPFFM